MKKKLLLMAACLGAMFAFTACGSKDDGNTLTVLNYGKYIESSVLDAFEEETGIHVNYEEYVNPPFVLTKIHFQSLYVLFGFREPSPPDESTSNEDSKTMTSSALFLSAQS